MCLLITLCISARLKSVVGDVVVGLFDDYTMTTTTERMSRGAN